MDYIYGTAVKDGRTVENLKTIGDKHSNLRDFIETVQQFPDGTIITDRCIILQHYHTADENGKCYDWYYIDSHNRIVDTASASIARIENAIEGGASAVNLYDALASAIYMSKLTLNGGAVDDDDKRIRASGLYEDWAAGSYSVGDIRNAKGQTWECFQAHDNAIYPDINPDNSAWYTFWRPLHGKSPETARPYTPVQGAHDMYRTGEYMVYTDGLTYRCLSDTNFSPEDYAAAWEIYTEATEPEEPSPEPEEPTGYPEWVQPTGGHDAYNIGDIVNYNGTLYQSTINGNVWAPDAYPQGWEVVNG